MSTIAELHALFGAQRAAFERDKNPTLDARLAALATLKRACNDIADHVPRALAEDFGSHDPSIGLLWELGGVLGRIAHTAAHLPQWIEPVPRDAEPGAQSYVRYQPKGVVGNMAPWNFPIDISLGPLVDILAAGNRAIVKPSELAPACAELVAATLARHFDPELVTVVTGGTELAQAFAELPWGHLLYTGNPAVGRKVMAAAAKNLTPVTLELGGKCPTIVAADRCNADTFGEILSIKAVKSGQVCINTDYVLVPREQLGGCIAQMRALWAQMFPRFVGDARATGIINARHFDRLQGYLDEARSRGVTLIPLNDEAADRAARTLPLTLLIDPPDDLQVMQEEIFGPLLPIKTYAAIDDAIDYVNARPRPLALYVFTDDASIADDVLARTLSGGACVNAIALHASLPSLPFGGVGESGMGAHHAYEGFQTFSHARSVYRRGPANPWELMRPPWGELLSSVATMVVKAP
jgi:coniferyl-aldehyde dehydrogenase